MAAADKPKRDDLVKAGFINTLSIYEFQPDQRMVEAALSEQPMQQQGGDCANPTRVPTGPSQFAHDRGTVPGRGHS